MNDKSHSDNDDYEQLRRLLLGTELDKIRRLSERLESSEAFSTEVGEVLPQAMSKSSSQGNELSEAMLPTVDEIVRLSIKRDINKFADALFPVIGPAIRKSIKETISQMMQSLNQTLEHSLSWQGFRWRMESARTGIPFAQIALLHGLIYQVDQVFLIHRETGLLLCHLGRDDIQNQNADLVSSMLSAINDFVGDSFEVEQNKTLERIQVGELSIWIEPGPDAILALAIRGEAPNSLRITMQQVLEQVQNEFNDDLAGFDGDTAPFESRDDILSDCLQERYKESTSKGLPVKPIAFAVVVLLLLFVWSGIQINQSWQRDDYVNNLRSQAGYVVTDSQEEDGVFVIKGLRDPLAVAPAELLAQSPFLPEEVSHLFEPYQSLAPDFVEQRARRMLEVPQGVTLDLQQGILSVTGIADSSWRELLQSRVPLIPGVDLLDDSALQNGFSAANLNAPDSVTMTVAQGVLSIEGEAENDWIQTLATVSENYPDINAVDVSALVNLTEVEFFASIAELEGESVFFEVGRAIELENIDVSALALLFENIFEQGQSLSRNVRLVLQGYTDSVGDFEENQVLSLTRAEHVARLFFDAGINPEFLEARGLDAPVETEINDEERNFNRRVSFEVITE